MIARTWHGVTVATQADEYLDFLIKRAIPDYQSTAGNVALLSCVAFKMRRRIS